MAQVNTKRVALSRQLEAALRVAEIRAEELDRDAAWIESQLVDFKEIAGGYVLVLSKDYTPGHLHAAIDAYMRDFAEGVIGQLTADEYATSRAALVTTYRQPARTLREALELPF